MRKPFKSFGVAVRQGLLAAAFCVPMASAMATTEIPWKDETFERTSFDEDIRNVLRAVLKQNGLEVVFRPGVQGAVTSTFSRIPLRGAFNKLIEENGLSYEYSEDTKTITISTKEKSASEFVPLRNVDEAMIRSVQSKFRLTAEVIYEDKTRTVMLKGDPDQVAKLKDLIAKLETSQAEAIKAHHESEEKTTKASLTDAEAQMKAAEAQRIRDQNEAARLARLEVENVAVEVLQLHYASVSSTRVKFQGEDVTIPGVIDTLNSLLGISSGTSPTPQGGGSSSQPQIITPITSASQDAGAGTLAGNGGAGNIVSSQQPTIIVRKDPIAFRGTISPDTRTNSVIVRGTQREIEQVRKLLPKLDKQMEQVEIEAIIAVTSEGMLQKLGLSLGNDAAIGSKKGGTEIGGSLVSIPQTGVAAANYTSASGYGANGVPINPAYISPLSLLPTTVSPGGSLGSFLYRGASYALTAQLNAAAQDNTAHVLASPRVVTLDNIAAKISTDGTTYFPTSAGANGSGGFISIPAGVTLKITPSILQHEDVGDDNLIRLVIEAENTSVKTGSTPSRAGQQIQTQVIIPDGSTFIMGGMTNDSRTESLDHVPLISEIPILGELFKNRSSSQSLDEALFFITPRVVPHADLYSKDVAEKRYLQSQRAELDRTGASIRNDSQLLKLNTKTLEEDE